MKNSCNFCLWQRQFPLKATTCILVDQQCGALRAYSARAHTLTRDDGACWTGGEAHLECRHP